MILTRQNDTLQPNAFYLIYCGLIQNYVKPLNEIFSREMFLCDIKFLLSQFMRN